MSGTLRTARQVGDRLGVTAETVLRYHRKGWLRGRRLPGTTRGRLRFLDEDVDAMLEANGAGAADRGVSATRTDCAHGSVDPLRFEASATRPPGAARTEEDS